MACISLVILYGLQSVILPQAVAKSHDGAVTKQKKVEALPRDNIASLYGNQPALLDRRGSRATSLRTAANASEKNLSARCKATKKRVSYFANKIKGTLFDGLLEDIIHRLDVLISQIDESPIVDALAIDNAAECRAMGMVVEDIFGKIVQSTLQPNSEIQFAKDKQFGHAPRKCNDNLGKEGAAQGNMHHIPLNNVPSVIHGQSNRGEREVLRADVIARLREDVRREVYRTLEEQQRQREREKIKEGENEAGLTMHGKAQPVRGKKADEHVPIDPDDM